ncbi:hypothetical protein K2173_023018 [Erythroxylum novogranatense]|uniref:Sister chromatid cohesion protein PDS5 homolog A n=1 Tax=Erythroxylum novogranatense TaxID=1862640 RepID=A0AAV8T9A2_9ROSI|nr:hypothetical protein K2173_023018 [Erythroxylum novogranatense]
MDEPALLLLSEIGESLCRLARPNKDLLVKSLRQAANSLSQIEQPLSPEWSDKIGDMKKVEAALKSLRKSIVKHALFRHSDKDVKLLVSICVTDFFRILAPKPPFEDKHLRDVFKLIISTFAELADISSPYFSKRAKIVETVARCKCCVIMLDIDCNDLVLEMFNTFFSVVRECHGPSLINDLLSIMTSILNEEASQPLSDVILGSLVKEGQAKTSAASRLAASVIQACTEMLEPFICGFLTSCSLHRDSVESELKEFYHEILFEVFQAAPQILLTVIPNLIQELQTDQVDVRIKAVKLVGKLFALPEQHVAQKYQSLFMEFKNRFSDKSVEVRLSALQCVKDCYMANPCGKESSELLLGVEGRLLDFDDKVRTQAVVVVCDLAISNLKFFPCELISKATERLRDKKISVRKKTLKKLIELYQDYCRRCFGGHMSINDHLEQIPCKVLMLCFDKDSKEFRSQNLESILAEDLFPVFLPVEERTRHWIHLFSLFTPMHRKALNSILSQKQRFQMNMRTYLALRKSQKEASPEEILDRTKKLSVKMSASFQDPLKAEEGFLKLSEMTDSRIFNALEQLLDEQMAVNAQEAIDNFLQIIGDKHPHLEFLQLLSTKCSFNVFSPEHIQCILNHISKEGLWNDHTETSSANLLMAIINIFPSFLRGAEQQFWKLLEEKNLITDTMIQVLAKAGPYISDKFRDFYPFLERLCLEGTRVQSKHAVSAIASMVGSSEQIIFSKLCKELVDFLHCSRNIPTVLQSLGCIAQHSISVLESHFDGIRSYIFEHIFPVEQNDNPALSDETSKCSDSCKLKIYGLKVLVKSFLPHQGSNSKWSICDLLGIVEKMLQTGDAFDGIISSERDKPYIRLAAAKSILQLSRKWDLFISPEIFRSTMLLAKDSSSFVGRSFMDKTHRLLDCRVVPIRYACVFALIASDGSKDLRDASLKYMEAFIKQYRNEACMGRASVTERVPITNYPAYIVVFLIHILAHDTDFPPQECHDEQVYAQICSPLFQVIRALLDPNMVNGNVDLINDTALYLLSIFRAVKRADDALDCQRTPKLQILSEIGISIVNTLHHNGVSMSRAPGMIMLPSSLYKLSPVQKCDEVSSKHEIGFHFGECFVKGVVHTLKSQTYPAASTITKRVRKGQEDNVGAADFNHDSLNPASQWEVDLSRMGRAGAQRNSNQEIISRQKRKKAVSPTSPDSIELHNNCIVVEVGKKVGSKSSRSVMEKEKTSCDSTSAKSLIESQVSTETTEKILHSTKENAGTSSDITLQSCKYSRTDCTRLSSSRLSHCEEMVLPEESNKFYSSNCNSLDSSDVDSFGDGATKQSKDLANKLNGKFANMMTSIPAKGKKGRKLSTETSLEEIANLNEEAFIRRSRRRKA